MANRTAELGPSRRTPLGPKFREAAAAAFSDNGKGVDFDSISEGSGSEGESENGSTEQEYQDALPPRPNFKGKGSATMTGAKGAPPQKKRGSWADLDLSIIVALVSPAGNWLTGGDHIKNIFLIVLLIFYLHQIIEIPWQLYLSALPKKSTRRAPSLEAEGEKSANITELAQGELRRHELMYLGLSIVSPIIGAAFLRHVLYALGDGNTLSWFSTTLFVLATGIRPWTHLINRLKDRTHELHTALHYPDEESFANLYEQSSRALHDTVKRVDALEREVRALREDVKRLEQLREVCDDLTEVLGDVERATKRNERKADAGRAAQSVRLTALEQGLTQLEERRRKDVVAFEAAGLHLPSGASFLQRTRSSLATLVDKLLRIPRTIILFGLGDSYGSEKGRKALHINLPMNGFEKTNGHDNGNGNGDGTVQFRIRSPDREKHLPHLVPRLATIPEAEDPDSEETFVSDRENGGPATPSATSPHKRHRRKSFSSGAGHAQKPSVRQMAYESAQSVVLWPYRFSVQFIVAMLPPMQKIMPED